MGSTDGDDDDDDERNPLCVACAAGCLQEVGSLLAAGEDPNVVGSQRTTPLFIACERECPELVAMLLAARADPDLPAFGGATPLFIASTRNQASIARLLVDANAQLDFVGDNDYYTPLLACTKRGSDEVAKVLRPPCPAPPGPTRRPALERSQLSSALSSRPDQVLLQRGASVHLRSDKWGTLLHSAAAAGHVTLLKLLVAAGAALGEEHRGKTALQVSEERGHTAAAMVLRRATTLERRAASSAPTSTKTAEAAREAAEAEAAEAAAAPPQQKKPRKKKKKKDRATGEYGEYGEDGEHAGETAAEGAAEGEEVAAAAPHSPPRPPVRSPGRGSPTRGSLEGTPEELRADGLLAGRAIAEIAGEAARKNAHAVAVEGVAAAVRQDGERVKLRALASQTARRQAKACALEQAAATAKQEAERCKLRGLAGAARKANTTSGVTALHRMTLRASRDGADGAVEKLREAWLRQQDQAGDVD